MPGADVKGVAKLLGEEITELPWFNYNLGGSYGGKLSKKADNFTKTHGTIIAGIEHKMDVGSVIKRLLNNDFSEIAGFYVGILAFYTQKVLKNVEFLEDSAQNSLYKLIIRQKTHIRYKNDLKKIEKMTFDFKDFLYAASHNKKLFFDYNSALSVYKLQGDDAIFGILCQIFWVNRYCDKFSVQLINDLPIKLHIEVSDFLSGCHFPVMVSPYNGAIKWQKNGNGWFLYQKIDKKWRVLDCIGTNFTILAEKPLANRLNFIGGGGQTVPYVICQNWGEIIKTVAIFGQEVLIRDLRNDFFNHYWFVFGPNSKINVKYIRRGIWNDKKYYGIPIEYDNVSNHRNGHSITVTLNKEFCGFCDKKDICFSAAEAHDWFEIGEKCKTLWKN